MNKDELLNKLYKLKRYEVSAGVLDFMSKSAVKFNHVLALFEQLDEPEEVVIPQFVEDWIENVRGLSSSMSYLMAYDQINRFSHELALWCYESGNNDNLHKLARAWLDGYKVEKEPLYLIRFSDNQYAIKDYEGGIRSVLVDKKFANQFTRVEIDKLGIEYWAFAIQVGEETP